MPPRAGRQAGEANLPDANAGQLTDRMADGSQHSAHLAVAALKNGQFHFRLPRAVGAVALVAAAKADILGGLGGAVLQIDAPAQNIQGFLGGDAAHFRAVGFGDMIAGMRELVKKIAVVGEKNQAFRVYIEPSYRAQHRLVAQIHQVGD